VNLGIKGASGIVCGADTDLGAACSLALLREGVEVIAVHSNADIFEALINPDQQQDLASLQGLHCDIHTEAGRKELLAVCPNPDILVNHGAGPPAGDFRDWNRDDWIRALDQNLLTAVEMIRLFFDGMVSRGFGRIINITSQSVKAPMAALDLSNAARAGLTGFVGGVSRHKRNADVTINNLLPGMFKTRPLQNHIEAAALKQQITLQEAATRLTQGIPLQRFGHPEEFGALCAFLCGRQAGFINGQNILIDGGAFPGTF